MQLTYCDLAERCLQSASDPVVAAQLAYGGNTELVMQMLADHMDRFRVSQLHYAEC